MDLDFHGAILKLVGQFLPQEPPQRRSQWRIQGGDMTHSQGKVGKGRNERQWNSRSIEEFCSLSARNATIKRPSTINFVSFRSNFQRSAGITASQILQT